MCHSEGDRGKAATQVGKRITGKRVGMTASMTPNEFTRISSISPMPHRYSYLLMAHEDVELALSHITQYIITQP